MKLWQKILGVVMIIAGVFLVGGEVWATSKRYKSFNYETGANFVIGSSDGSKAEEIKKVNELINSSSSLSTLKDVRKAEHKRVLNEANKYLDDTINTKITDHIEGGVFGIGKYTSTDEFKKRKESAVEKWEKDNNKQPDTEATEAIEKTIIEEKKKELRGKYVKDVEFRTAAFNSFIRSNIVDSNINSTFFYRYILKIENPDLDLSDSDLKSDKIKECLSGADCYGRIEMKSLEYILDRAKKNHPTFDEDGAFRNAINELINDENTQIRYQKTVEEVPFDKSAPDINSGNKSGSSSKKNKDGSGVDSSEESGLSEADKQQEECRKNSGFFGFIICPILFQTSESVLSKLYDTLYGGLSKIEPKAFEFGKENPVFAAWSSIRDMANIVFIIAFLIVVFSQLTGLGIDNYGIKKILPKLIASAILINLSFVISQLFVDTSNILGASLSKIFNQVKFNKGTGINAGADGTAFLAIGGVFLSVVAIAILNPGTLISLILLLIPMVGALLLAVALLMVRQAVAVMLVVTSPIAIALMLLPNTKSLVDRYKKLASAMWLFYPICAIIMGGSLFAARVFLVLANSGGTEHEFLYKLMGLAIMTLPFFATPALLRKTMDGVGGIGSKFTKLRDKSVGKLSEKANNSRLARRARSGLNSIALGSGARARGLSERNKLRQERREKLLSSNRQYMDNQDAISKLEHDEKLNPLSMNEKMQAAQFKHEEATDASLVAERMRTNEIRHEEAMDSTMREDRMKTAEMNHQVSMADAGSRTGMAGYYNTMTNAKINSAQSRTEKQMRDATMDAISAGNLELGGGSWIDGAGVKHTAPARITNPNDANQMRQALQAAASSNNHIAAGAIMEYMNKNGMTDDVHRAYKEMSNGGAMGMNIEDSAYKNVRSAMANGVLAAGIKEDDPGMAKWAKNTLAGKATTVDDSTIEAFADMSADAISKMDDKAMARTQAVLQERKAVFVGSGTPGGKIGQAINNMDNFKKAMTGTSDNDLRLQNKTKANLRNQTMKW